MRIVLLILAVAVAGCVFYVVHAHATATEHMPAAPVIIRHNDDPTSIKPTASPTSMTTPRATSTDPANTIAVDDDTPAVTLVPQPIRDVAPDAAAAAAAAANDDPTVLVDEPTKDDARLIDHRFILRGSGTESDPYQVHWDMLLSAENLFEPTKGTWVVPARLKMLDQKWAELTGFLGVPVFTTNTDRVLLTWKMIDACHGVAFKPYQAIETVLATPIDINPHTVTALDVVGKLALDPKLEQGWRTCLFRIEHCKMISAGR